MLRQVQVKNGSLRGLPAADPRVTVFRGIPFAAPPVGDLRWKAPQPAADWEGVRDAFQFAPIAMQKVPGSDPTDFYAREFYIDPTVPMSEDCLYLNVWTPAKSEDEKLPVMVWIYGGAFAHGYTSEMEFNGERIARRGVILVSVAYRVNVFGFLAHPELCGEEGPSANFGLLDQRAGLQWVQDNISAFGGDPTNVTVFGQSAGGMSVLAHLTSPQSEGLFQKAIVMSAGGIRAAHSAANKSLQEAADMGLKFQEFCGAGSLAELRAIDEKQMYELGFAFSQTQQSRPFGPCLDDFFLPEDPSLVLLDNRRHKVAVMTGHTTNDFRRPPAGVTDPESFVAYAKEAFGDKAEEYLRICEFDKGDLERSLAIASFPGMQLGCAIWLEENARQGNPPIYGYCFDADMPGDDAGAFHSSDLWFVFESLAACWRPFTGKHYDLARRLCNYYTNFAKTGDPNGPDADGSPMPRWEPYTLDAPYSLYLGDSIQMQDKRDPLMQFLTDFALEWHESRR